MSVPSGEEGHCTEAPACTEDEDAAVPEETEEDVLEGSERSEEAELSEDAELSGSDGSEGAEETGEGEK